MICDRRRSIAERVLHLPIGAFGIDAEGKIGFKYVYALAIFETIDREAFLETLLLWLFILDTVSALIEEINDGDRSAEGASMELRV